MKINKAFIILILMLPFTSSIQILAQPKNIQTSAGTVEGLQKGNVIIFKGIPYASPPVGELRWKSPQGMKSWTGIKKCINFSASAMQSDPVPFMMWTEEFIAPPKPLSEDCLYLNIWSPSQKGKESYPVVVWIHGGAFTSGAASCAVYDGEEMAKKGIVFVSINYRLGIFGFLAHPDLSNGPDQYSSGNLGILDQIAALKWIQQNIAAFGGNSAAVTIAGQSAGSFSVNALVASPLAKGLFLRAIAQSGGILNGRFLKFKSDAENDNKAELKNLGIESISELRNKTEEEIQALASKMPRGSFSPVFDNVVLHKNLDSFFKAGSQNDVALLTGWVTGDGGLMGPSNQSADEFITNANQLYGDKSNAFLELFPSSTESELKKSQEKNGLLQFAGISSHKWSLYNKQKAYMYEFRFVPTDKSDFPNYGAFHTSDVPFAYHTLAYWKRPWQKRDLDMEKIMNAYWVNFIKTGNPNGKGLPEWKPYDKSNGNIMVLDEKTMLHPGLYKKEFAFFDAL
jgi:para-nitrobenzyl esterase